MKNESLRERAMELLRYDAESGELIWRSRRGGAANVGSVAGNVDKSKGGYVFIRIDRKPYRAHRIIWLMLHGYLPDQIDHIDGDCSNNRLTNLRGATNAENNQNVAVRSNNTSGFTGVSWNKRENKWQAKIQINGQIMYLGHHDTVEAAAKAYAEAKQKHHTFHPKVVTRIVGNE